MKSYILLATLLSFSLLNAEAIFTGDKKLACEAILCLSTGKPPTECKPALRKYFSLRAIPSNFWGNGGKSLTEVRKDFLKLCPTDSDTKDPELNKLKNIMINLDVDTEQCTASYLNNHPETMSIEKQYRDKDGIEHKIIEIKYRVRTTLPKDCNSLIQHKYTDLKPVKNICPTGWYSQDEWERGYIKIPISKNEFLQLEQSGYKNIIVDKSPIRRNFSYCKYRDSHNCYKYYKIEKIKKDCWIEINRK